MIQYKFLLHFSIRIIISFIFFTAVGTLSHELGHVAVAKYFGYETTLSYAKMNFDYPNKQNDPLVIELRQLAFENSEEIIELARKTRKDYVPESKTRFLEVQEILKQKYPYPKPNSHWIILGGPTQTILTSFLGLFILFYRKSKNKQYFVLLDWLGVFLALFALREVFNFVIAVINMIFDSSSVFNGDEFRLSRELGMNQMVLPALGFVLGAFISGYVILKIIPLRYRFTFIISGLIGSIAGFFFWLRFLGPMILP